MEDFTMKSLQLLVATIIATTVFPAFGMSLFGNKLSKLSRRTTRRYTTEPKSTTLVCAPQQRPVKKSPNKWTNFKRSNFATTNLMVADMRFAIASIKSAIKNNRMINSSIAIAKESIATAKASAKTYIEETKESFADLKDAAKQGFAIDKAKAAGLLHEDDKAVFRRISKFFFGK